VRTVVGELQLSNEGTSGGFKEVIFEVSGEDVYGTLKFEAVFTVYNECHKQKLKDAYISSDSYGASGSGGI
jgi:protein subunit release factor B